METTSCLVANLSCFSLASLYVGSLYIWNSNQNRDHPDTVKKRFISALCMAFISPLFVVFTSDDNTFKTIGLLQQLGVRLDGAINAIVLPLVLTSILFAGPISVQLMDGTWKVLLGANYWKKNLNDILWIRNHVIAPISEEFTFRACMLPLLTKCFTSTKAILVCPLFFGVAHFHHMIERIRQGMPISNSLLISCFQFTYTTLFGMYSAFLFMRTGHVIAPCVVHAFCNAMGFPDFSEIFRRNGSQRFIVGFCFGFGLLGWCLLLWPLTKPELYLLQLK